jgi:catechol 2,3-dioxygenase-like lactoylglutathione lyase family enzyme
VLPEDGLVQAPLMFVFLDISSLPRQRRLYERELGFRVIENQFHPPHEHHGLVKYDAGRTILAINLFAERKFLDQRQDAVTLVCRSRALSDQATLERSGLERYGVFSDGHFTDVDGHHYVFLAGTPDDSQLVTDIVQLRVQVLDLDASIAFYHEVLGLPVLAEAHHGYLLGTGSLDILLESAPSRALDVRYNACLMVFYTADASEAEHALEARGLTFTSPVRGSDIGLTGRFKDPSGHVFCIYQPSAESLTWGSAGKVMELMTAGVLFGRSSQGAPHVR